MDDITNTIQSYYADRDVWLLSSPINRDLYVQVSDSLESHENKKEKCTLFLTTNGGNPDAAFRIARAFKHYYPEEGSLRIVICGLCKSAGTLIAIGADELSIGDMGELGPLDIQVSKSNEFIEQVSGLEIQESLDSIQKHAYGIFRDCLIDIKLNTRVSMKMAGELASSLALGVVSPLYAQIDPDRIGELKRAMKIAAQYGEQLNAKTKNLKEDQNSLEKIISGYPSHSFVIDRKESTNLFKRVYDLSSVERIIFQLFKYNGLIYPNKTIMFLNLDIDFILKVLGDKLSSENSDGQEDRGSENGHTEIVGSGTDVDSEAGAISETENEQTNENTGNGSERKPKPKTKN